MALAELGRVSWQRWSGSPRPGRFSFYLQNFADYNATYGSLGAVMGLMMWTWISVIILLVGAEINAEMEHQTMRDSTTGLPLPMGMRGATVADTIGPTLKEAKTRAEIEADKPNGPFAAQLAMRLTVVLGLAMLVGQFARTSRPPASRTGPLCARCAPAGRTRPPPAAGRDAARSGAARRQGNGCRCAAPVAGGALEADLVGGCLQAQTKAAPAADSSASFAR